MARHKHNWEPIADMPGWEYCERCGRCREKGSRFTRDYLEVLEEIGEMGILAQSMIDTGKEAKYDNGNR